MKLAMILVITALCIDRVLTCLDVVRANYRLDAAERAALSDRPPP